MRILVSAVLLALFAIPASLAAEAPPKSNAAPALPSPGAVLKVASWGGAYQAAQADIVFKPFSDRTGVAIQTVPFRGGLEDIKSAAEEGRYAVVDLAGEDAAAACAAGLLTSLDPATFARGGDDVPAEKDFLTHVPCAVPSTLMSEVVIYDPTVYSAHAPRNLADFFDQKTFPGKRGLKRDAMGTLEMALLADNVAPKDVYKLLATEPGLARAFAKLDTIKSAIMWWEKGESPAAFVGQHDVVMSTAYNTRAYLATVAGAQIAALWDEPLVYTNAWGVLKSAKDAATATEFVKFATDTVRLASFSEIAPYGPARRSALAGVSPEMRAFSPSADEHMARAFFIDPQFWYEKGASLRGRFEIWAAQGSKPQKSQ